MSAPVTTPPAPAPTGAGGGRLLHRLGVIAVTVALVALGLAAGLWLGSPASAATGDLEVDTGDGNGFTNAPGKLLDVSELAPGASASGDMTIKDTSGNGAGSGVSDAVSLQMVNVICDGTSSCAGNGAGTALADALDFTLDVYDASNTLLNSSSESVSSLTSGVMLASRLHDGDTVDVTLNAALPQPTGNDVQYGTFGFNLALSLDATTNGGGGGGNGGGGTGGGGTGNNQNTGGNGGTTGNNEQSGNSGGSGNGIVVEGEHQQESGGSNGGASGPGASNGNGGSSNENPNGGGILVLGESGREGGDTGGILSYTGAPIRLMLLVGGAVLILGAALLFAGRRRRRYSEHSHEVSP